MGLVFQSEGLVWGEVFLNVLFDIVGKFLNVAPKNQLELDLSVKFLNSHSSHTAVVSTLPEKGESSVMLRAQKEEHQETFNLAPGWCPIPTSNRETSTKGPVSWS